MLLHHQIRICLPGQFKFDRDWNCLLQNGFYIKLRIIILLECFMYNIEGAITFAILEK